MADRLWDVACALHADPETAFEEHHAADRLCAELEWDGFTVDRGVAGMPTAFVAQAGTGGGPRIALLLEYDALPGLGHACGHNLIAAAGLGAAIAAREAAGHAGTILAIGTPAEEGGGGKIIELGAGLFEGVDAALMFHPGTRNWSWAVLTAQVELRIAYHGRAAHPTGNPAEGIDALASLIQLFTTLSALRQRLPAGSHIQGIVTRGGEATNIVPDLAEGRFGLRALTTGALQTLIGQVTAAAQGIAAATAITVEVDQVREPYAHFRPNERLGARFDQHIARHGITMTPPEPGVFLGSSDIGNISTAVPAIHPFVAIVDSDKSDHTPQFAAAAASGRGRHVMLAAADALGRTAVELLTDPALRTAAWQEFQHRAAAGH
ncbi:amidohydrolase [Actinocrispum sp. NPDC049592]|uniref:amidohydrolase n=1 Tax=Actinocrispum sp. NPDC049592 TaxID=3154835 RepID=UPI0034428D4F